MSTISRFNSRVQTKIIDCLERQPMSLAELADKTLINYSSVRKAVRQLEANGVVRPTGHELRNVKYSLGENPDFLNYIIPKITSDGKQHKLNVLLSFRSKHSVAGQAISNLPRNITRIFNIALRMSRDENIDFSAPLKNIRWNMEQDAKALQNVLSLYEQVLNDDRIWNTKFLGRFHKDYDFNEEEITEAYNHFFKEE